MMTKSSIVRFKLFSFTVLLVFSLCPDVHAKAHPPTKYDSIIRSIAANYGLEPTLIHSIIRTESNYDPDAVSPKGAMGLMQLMPETAERYGVRDIYNPRENIEGGVKYLKYLMDLYNRKTDYVLAAYNAGHNAVKKYGGIPPFPETR